LPDEAPEADQSIADLLDRVRARRQTIRVLQACMRSAVAVSAVLIVALIVTRWAAQLPVAVTAFGLVALGLMVVALLWGFVPLRQRPSDAQIARFIEEHTPSLDDRLVTAVELMNRPVGQVHPSHSTNQTYPTDQTLSVLLLADASERARTVDVDTVVPVAALRRTVLRAVSAVAVLAGVAFLAVGPARQVADAASLVLLPSSVRLDVRPGNARVAANMPLSIEAQLVGNQSPIQAHIQIGVADQWKTVEMTKDPAGVFRLDLQTVTAPFTYRVLADKLTSPSYTVALLRPPRVTRIDVDYTFPPALGLPPRTQEDGGDIYAPIGTDARIRIHTDVPVSSGHLTLADGTNVELSVETPTQITASVNVVRDNSYRVEVLDREGLSNGLESEYFIRVVNDRPPEVHVTRPASDRTVTRLEEVDIEAKADDDYGLDRLELVYAVRGGSERIAALDIPRRATSVSARRTLYLEDLDLQPGDFVSYYVRARDIRRATKSNETRSDIFFLEVRPYEQAFSLAQSQSMAGSGYAGAIDELVNAQKQIVVATWKLDRRARSGGGRPEQDIRAVARVETDLKSRVERTASSFRESTMRDPRRRLSGGDDGARKGRADEDAMTAAATAMGRAADILEALKTEDAISPEMEALNRLLQAQAEVKHRQVAMDQSAAGAAGNSNHNFDISTLFDQELRRQQQTSYEAPRALNKPQVPDSALLDRIKDLARRQDELLKRQLEVGRAQTSPNEIKRQLEQLMREQSDLRRAVDELARQTTRSGELNRSPGEGDGSTGMREISEAMRDAAGELQRGAPREAGSRASRALQRLRDLERQLQLSQPDERRRALGELALEARQLADLQRQIASEIGKLAPVDTADAMRRLAGEEERLADRARRLLGAAKEQAGTKAIAGEAAQEEVQRLAERMQQSADQMRATGGAAGASRKRRAQESTQQELARQLDRFADRLTAAGGDRNDKSRELSAGLAQARDLREKLEQIARALESADRENRLPAGQRGNQKMPGERGRTGEGRQGAGGLDMTKLNEDSLRHLRDAKDLINQLRRDDPSFSQNGAGFTLEGQGMISSAPGTEGFKQDFAKWEMLRHQVALALEQAEGTLSRKLQADESKNRMAAGVEDKAPQEYQKQVENYFKALATKGQNKAP
jgi:Domain of unknown function (DUF4175)